jgi:hypothetical protein
LDFVISPFFHPLLIVVVTTLSLAWVLWQEVHRIAKGILGVLVVLLGVIALRPALVTRSAVPPSEPVQITYENSVTALREGTRSRARKLANRLEGQLNGATVNVAPLDDRWDSPPVFRDYNRLEVGTYSRSSLHVIVGDGRHTRSGAVPRLPAAGRRYRALLRAEDSRDTQVPSVRISDPVRRMNTEGRTTWNVVLQHADQLAEPQLVIRDEDRVINRRSVEAVRSQRLRVSTPRRGRGQYYFEAALVDREDTRFPPGNPRRTGVGLTVDQDRQRVLVSSQYPEWPSGWWGRAVAQFGSWEVDYHHRSLERGGSEETSRADVVVYHGFPTSTEGVNQFRKFVEGAPRVLWIPREPDENDRVESTLDVLGLSGPGPPVVRKGQFQWTISEDADLLFPALSRYNYLLRSSPPLSSLVTNVDTGGAYRTVLRAGSRPVLGISEARGVAILRSPGFHRWAMTWGQLGRPEVGGELAREFVAKLMRMRSGEGGRRLGRRWIMAGSPVTIRRGSDTVPISVTSPWMDDGAGTIAGNQLTFSRPGLYTVEGEVGGTAFSESIIVIEPEEERLPGRGQYVRSLVGEEGTFRTIDAVETWAREAWQERTRERRRRLMGWNHFAVLLVLASLLTGAWFLRDRGG